MIYKFGTIMSWIAYVNAGIWEVDKRNDYAEDPAMIINKKKSKKDVGPLEEK